MAGVKFYLEKRKDKSKNLIVDNVPILLYYSFNGQRLQYFTGERIDTRYYIDKYWKKVGQQPVKKTAPKAEMINRNLDTLRLFVEKTHSDFKALQIVPTVSLFTEKLDEAFKSKEDSKKSPKELTTNDALDLFTEFVKGNFSFNTYRNSLTAVNHIKDFIGESKTKRLFLDGIDKVFVEDFRQYLVTQGHLNNTVVKNLDKLRRFLSWAEEKGYYSNSDVKIVTKENDIEVIFLNYEELKYLQTLKIKNTSLERVRDIFVFACFTGMRYGDIFKLKKLDIKANQIQFFITKGGNTISHTVPLVNQSRAILEKYSDLPGDKALPVISNQKMNDYIKEVMKLANFNDVVTIAEKQGNGKVIENTYEKWELISCHTSRKTFITVSMTLGMPEAVIKSISGHTKNSRAFTKYYTVVDSLKQAEMNKIFGGI
jgi:integrase